MKLSSAMILAAATGSYASVETIRSSINAVENAVDSFSKAAKSLATESNLEAVKSQGEALVSAIQSSQASIEVEANIDASDALVLGEPVKDLAVKVESLAGDLESRIAAIEKADVCNTVVPALRDIDANFNGLLKSIVGKVPKSAQLVASPISSRLTSGLKQVRQEIESKCKGKVTSGSNGTGNSSASGLSVESSASVSFLAPGCALILAIAAAIL
ncbi:cell wall protein [Metarhizium rileyi]|uniref:Cell wall protein n=1 Tax=Metarhizium rileyi (strain RCEF 4871) TaxID=1649241 RepID=A0A162JFV1_METRR|nr:cell wall protein [Metarhizium rileyi RCEF 4871]